MAKSWVMVVCFSCLFACAQVPAAGEKPAEIHVPLTVVFSGNQCFCEQTNFDIKQFSGQGDIDAFLKKDSARTLGISTKEKIEPLDFEKNIIVAILMGKKPSAGYRFTLSQDTAKVKNETAVIEVAIKEPAANTLSAQMITSPCLLVQLPKGNYNTIKVVSKENQQLVNLSILK